MTDTSLPRVRAVRCDHRAQDDAVYAALCRATDPLDGAWERLTRARRITVKFNQARVAERRHMFEGNLRELVDGRVARAVLRLLRERTDAEIVCTEISNDALWTFTISSGCRTCWWTLAASCSRRSASSMPWWGSRSASTR